MKLRLVSILALLVGACPVFAVPAWQQIDVPPHLYHQRTPLDRFTRLKDDLESGRIALDRNSEKDFVISLLRVLEVPVSSQMLVFSTTSLQLRLITPSNPRALYFTDDLYVGYIPGGKIEIVSLDPELGAIFYLFDIPRSSANIRAERSERCINCHVAADTGFVPGLVVKSVVPGPGGGSLAAYRQEQTGHDIPFEQRFGGWYVTGKHGITEHWGNVIGRLFEGKLSKRPIEPGTLFDFARYPAATSDILPQLLLEHQAGFVNRVVEASYRARTAFYAGQGRLDDVQNRELDDQARLVTRYLLFADEVPLPAGGVEGDAAFKSDFLRNRRAASSDASLKDFDLTTRLFRHRCSYMIYSPVFQGLPAEMKQRIYGTMKVALDSAKSDADYAYLPASEKDSIRDILRATLSDLPPGW
ncbi:MAG TPA: hypothetical protein VFD27_08470 [Chthoniobacteraceae bacterium]|nr:hypothetical protein [Chthoniobacteraceae bacterium]